MNTHLSEIMSGASLRFAIVDVLRASGEADTAAWLYAHRDDPDLVQTFDRIAAAMRPRIAEQTNLRRVVREFPDVEGRVRVEPVAYQTREGLTLYKARVYVRTNDPKEIRAMRRSLHGYGLGFTVLWEDAPAPDPKRNQQQLAEEIAATIGKDWKSGRGPTRKITSNEIGPYARAAGYTAELGQKSPYGGWDSSVLMSSLPDPIVRAVWSQTVPVMSDVVLARRAVDRKHREHLAVGLDARKAERAAVRDRRLDLSDLPPLPQPHGRDLVPLREAFVAGTRINMQTARDAYAGTSFSPERRAESEQAGAQSYMGDVFDSIVKSARTERQLEEALDGLRGYRAGWISRRHGELGKQSGIVSTMIAGGSNFPADRMNKRNDQLHRRQQDNEDWSERALRGIHRRIERIGIEEAGGDLAIARRRLAQAVERGKDSATIQRLDERVEELRQRARAKASVVSVVEWDEEPRTPSDEQEGRSPASQYVIEHADPGFVAYASSPVDRGQRLPADEDSSPYDYILTADGWVRWVRGEDGRRPSGHPWPSRGAARAAVESGERAALGVASDAPTVDPVLRFGPDVTVELDPADERIRVFCPKASAVNEAITARGFVWSRREGARQRKFTESTAADIDVALAGAGLIPARTYPVTARYHAMMGR